jgi:two-component system probable response regulator PhcQ
MIDWRCAMRSKLLLVDDDAFVQAVLRQYLNNEPYEVHTASGGEQALDLMKTHCFKVVISDECMIGMQGNEFLALVRESYPDTVRILLTGHATLEATMKAVNHGEIYRFLCKSCSETDITFAVRSAIEKYDLECENHRLLSTIKRQSLEMKVLEHRFPGIGRVEKDDHGKFVLDDLPDDEIHRWMAMCDQEIEDERGKD